MPDHLGGLKAAGLEHAEGRSQVRGHAHYAGAVPLDLLKSEQQRISDELVAVKGRLEAASASLERVRLTADLAAQEAENCTGPIWTPMRTGGG
ncbi:MAG: hypothetical protein QOI20_2721 [Acidimicrobiaceae bacterium]|nr:hypothetical protein [Acidimicrobiaceae bacterium]